MTKGKHALRLKRLGIATYKEAIIYIRRDSYICKAEGFEAQSRIQVTGSDGRYIIATLNMVVSDLLEPDEASLSEYAWDLLKAREGEEIFLSHPEPLDSLGYVRAKIYGKALAQKEFHTIIDDVVAGRLSDIQIAAFLTATAAHRLQETEIFYLTKAMLQVGNSLTWPKQMIVDKHCIGGLPGYKTTMIVVPIVAAFGLMIPKTSSRAITSAAGTADSMATLAPVELSLMEIKKVVAREGGCIAWGGRAGLSPADDILIRVERGLNLDSEAQLTASILSKKAAAGSSHILIDIPFGPTAKIRNMRQAELLKSILIAVAKKLGIFVEVILTDGAEPIGSGIGPALEAQDVLLVLQNKPEAPQDLRERALLLAGKVLEFSPQVKVGEGRALAENILKSGRAWQKMQAICEAQGGMQLPGTAPYHKPFFATKNARVIAIDNRRIARLAKLAGAPRAKTAGLYLHVKIGAEVNVGDPILTIHAESKGELDYALNYLEHDGTIVVLKTDDER